MAKKQPVNVSAEVADTPAETVSEQGVEETPAICHEYQQGLGGRYTYDEKGNLVRVVDNEEGK